MGIYAFNTDVLRRALDDDHAVSTSRHDFGGDIIPRMVRDYSTFAFPYRGYWVDVGTIQAYWQAHQDLLADEPLFDLFERNWVIHTRSEERLPAGIRGNATVKQSLISDGCLVEGHVEHSVLSPGVIVRHGARVCDSVVMTDTVVEADAVLDHAILDKRIHVARGAKIGCDVESPSGPTSPGDPVLTVVGKNTRVPPGIRVGRNCAVAGDLAEGDVGYDDIPDGSRIGGASE
jgi:glucose-1-phosphate adenylyltransferase